MDRLIRSLSEARQAALDEPKRWNAAVYQGSETPLDNSSTTVHLFCTVKAASEKLRELAREHEAAGYKRAKWGISHGIVKFERGGEAIWLGLDKRKQR